LRSLSVKHSGGVGDIVFSIPALLSLVSQHRIERVTYYLQLNQHVQYSGRHPLGNLLLDANFAERLKPLLLAQACVQHVEIYNGQTVDVDFDLFRRVPINFTTYSIPRWYFLCVIGTAWDLSRPWLDVTPDPRFQGDVLVARNPRLQSPYIRYDFMDKYAEQIVFVGVRQEFDDFRIQCPRCTRFYEAPDFLELASVLAGCRFFVGNQGFIYTLAEALKITRLLETNPIAANNIPQGGNCYDALFQQGFEYWFDRLIQSKPRSASDTLTPSPTMM
jgi:hypothetical protein